MGEAASAAGDALRIAANAGIFNIDISTTKVEVARELCDIAREVGNTVGHGVGQGLGLGVGLGLSLGALYFGYPALKSIIHNAITKGVGGKRDDQDVRDIRKGSLRFELHCFTDIRFLEVLADYESGRMKERLQEELSRVGIRVEGLKVKIENMEEVNEKKKANWRSYLTKVLDEMTSNDMRELSEMTSDISMDAVDSKGLKYLQRETNNADTAESLYENGVPRDEMKVYKSTLESHREALKVSLEQHGEDHPATADIYYNIGMTQQKMKDFKSALESVKKSLAIRTKLFGDDHQDTANSYHSIGVTQHKMKDYKPALESKQKAFEIRSRLYGEDHPDTADSYNIGKTQHKMRNYKLALESKEKAFKARWKLFGENHPATADSYKSIGDTQDELGDYTSALESKQKALISD
ncbi:kinesin light chain 1-like [Dendronephthya gigantea]|uniref:kinesin light chain 1-like n=1 Tax=Dendronephthya gigantea TaxID=151771 RepID=UPI00106CC215|nr:kinesin light chain 1-like [Dendronephthya gigantea]